MSTPKANRPASDTNKEKGVPSAVANHPPEAATAMESMNSFTVNSAVQTGHSFSLPFQPAKSNHIFGASDGPINAGQTYTPTGVAFPPHAADGLHYTPGNVFGVDSSSFVAHGQDPAEASTSQHLAYARAFSTRDSLQYFSGPSSNTFAQFPSEFTFLGSNGLGIPLHLAPSCSTGLAQTFDPSNTDKQTSQGPFCFDSSGISPQTVFGNSDHTRHSLDKWTWPLQDPRTSDPQLGSIVPPTSTLVSDPSSQYRSSANSQTPESTFEDRSFPLEWPCPSLAEDLQLQDPKRAESSNEKEETDLPGFSHTTSLECICEEGSWLRRCPRLWGHLQSAVASGSTVRTCADGVHIDVVPRSCPAAATHLWVMVHENDRMVADMYQNAVQRNTFNNSTLYVNPLLFAPSALTANPYDGPLNPSSAATEGQSIPSSDLQLPSPTGPPSAILPIQYHNHAISVPSGPSVPITPEQCQPKPARDAGISLQTVLPSSEEQPILPTLGDLTSLNHSRKRSVSDDPAVPNFTKKQKAEPLPELPESLFYHKSGPALQIRHRSKWLGMPSKGDQKRKRGKGRKQVKGKGKGEGKRKGKGMTNDQPKEIIEATPYMDEVDKAFLDGALEKIRLAPFFRSPQQIECTVREDGACDLGVVRAPRSTGIGQVQEGDSIYFIFLSQIEDRFLCWICGHKMTVEKRLRALGHVRTHFEHRPFHCNWRIITENGEETPCGCDKSWTSKEAMHDEHQKKFTLYECTYCPTPTSCSTPSNLTRHIREMHPDTVEGSAT